MLSFVVVVLLHVVGGNESLVTLPPLARDTRWCGRHLSTVRGLGDSADIDGRDDGHMLVGMGYHVCWY